ncbi:hypothetical protein Tcan_06320 [Toxocara canis]|uniref:Uncharacterized protein n=1 Tax=Toxocara canis TaxID=6265 RepID=A0A0B2VDU8_TOXCA|nr:hypothetical protein Tcan_06320 [Toxocara canis]
MGYKECQGLQQIEKAKRAYANDVCLAGTLSSSSLLRIVRERVQSDRMLLVLFNKLNRAAPPGFEVADVDPAIPKLLVMFMNAYDKSFMNASHRTPCRQALHQSLAHFRSLQETSSV